MLVSKIRQAFRRGYHLEITDKTGIMTIQKFWESYPHNIVIPNLQILKGIRDKFVRNHRENLREKGILKPGEILSYRDWHSSIASTKPTYLTVEDFMHWFFKTPSQYHHLMEKKMLDDKMFVFEEELDPPTMLYQPVILVYSKPDPSWPKINFDGSFLDVEGRPKRRGCDAVVRDVEGDIEGYDYLAIPNANNIVEAEFEGLFLGLKLALKYQHREIIIEGDNKEIINVLKGISHVPLEYLEPYRIIFGILENFKNYRANFQFREGNQVANQIAHYSSLISSGDQRSITRKNHHKIMKLADRDKVDEPYFRVLQYPKICPLLGDCLKNISNVG